MCVIDTYLFHGEISLRGLSDLILFLSMAPDDGEKPGWVHLDVHVTSQQNFACVYE